MNRKWKNNLRNDHRISLWNSISLLLHGVSHTTLVSGNKIRWDALKQPYIDNRITVTINRIDFSSLKWVTCGFNTHNTAMSFKGNIIVLAHNTSVLSLGEGERKGLNGEGTMIRALHKATPNNQYVHVSHIKLNTITQANKTLQDSIRY